jgi:PAS domain S-box-containing protein
MLPSEAELCAALYERSSAGVAFTALDGTVIAANPAACRLWGRSERDVLGSPLLAFVHSGDRDTAAARLRELAEGRLDEWRTEQRFVRPDETVVWADSSMQAVRAPDGTPLHLQSVLLDVTDRRRTDEARTWLAAILESSPDAAIATSLDGVIMNWNAGAERILGYTAEEMVGRSARALRPPGGEEDRIARLMRRISRGERLEQRVVRLRKDGSAVTLLCTSTPIVDATGAVIGTATVARDLSERERTDAMFRSLIEAAPDAMVCVDHSGVIAFVNARAEDLFGYTRDELIGVPIELLVPHLTAREPIGRRQDGTTFPAEISLATLQTQEGTLLSAAIRDGTERRQVDALRGLEARKSAILDAALDCVITMDHNGQIVEFNSAAERVFGYDRDEVLGRPLADAIVPPDLRDAHRDGLARYLATGEGPVLGQRLELRAVRADGSEFPVELSITRVDLPGPPLFTASLRDITDRRRSEAERTILEDRLRQSERLESVGQLAGGIAHDFNNLLAAIINYAAFVAEETGDRPAVHADVQQIQAAAERAARLTKQLLTFARRDTIRRESLDINAIVAEIHRMLSRTIGEHILLRIEAAEALPAIRTDRGQIEQVLMNLAINARDAMPDGGTLTITTRLTELDEGYTSLHPDAVPGRHVELAVNDTGTGMSAEVADRIFEPFFTTKPRGEGTGLGLATVYGIVRDAGGSVSVHSEEGIGTTFRLYFPSAEAAVAAAPIVPPPGPHGLGATS